MAHEPVLATTGFVGREAELARLTGMLDAAVGGRGGMALVSGEAGIGKTRLAEEVAGIARGRGIRTLWGRCHEGEGAPAFWPWVQVLRVLLRENVSEAGDLVGLLPEIAGSSMDVPEHTMVDPAQARFRVFESVTALLTSVADPALRGTSERAASPTNTPPFPKRGLLLIFDDLQWADLPSLLLLRFLAVHLAESSMLVLGTYRDTEPDRDHPLTSTLGPLAGRAHVASVPLHGLEEGAIARLVQDAGAIPANDLVQELSRKTEGNPLFVREMLSLLASTRAERDPSPRMPHTVREVIGRRLRGASTACREVLKTAAVIGREFSVSVLADVAAEQVGTVREAMIEAEDLRLVEALPGGSGRYRFTHALMRDSLYGDWPSLRRARLHLRAGEALAGQGQPEPDRRPAELAYHFTQAAAVGGAGRAVEYARVAGDQALGQLAYEEAVRLYGLALQALDLVPESDSNTRSELRLSLGDAQTRAGDTEAGRASFWLAADAARLAGPGSDSGRLLARAALGIGGFALSIHPPMDELIALLEEALAALSPGERALRSLILGRLAMELHYGRDEARRDKLSREAVEIARRSGDARAVATALLVRHNAMRGPDPEQLLPLATEALALAEKAGDLPLALWISRVRAVDLTEVGGFDSFAQACAEHGRLAQRLGDPYHRWLHALWQAMQAALAGRFGEAEELAGRAADLGRQQQSGLVELCHAAQVAAINLETGAPADGLAVFGMMPERFPALDGLPALLALLQLSNGDHVQARATYERLVRGGAHAEESAADFDGLRRGGMWLMTLALLARAAVAFGDRPRMARLYDLLLPLGHLNVMVNPGVICFGAVSHHLGLLAAALLQAEQSATSTPDLAGSAITPEVAERHLLHALAFHERIGAPALVAHTRFVYAQFLLDQSEHAPGGEIAASLPGGRESHALGLLEQVAATAQALGMRPLAQATDRLLKRGNAMPPPERPTPKPSGTSLPADLSEREMEVLRLLAAGATNKQIGATLYLSPNTVRQHTISIYRKTGATGRAEATAWAARYGLL
jgi:DNA-binding CsgD family transcriptional regulator